MLQTQKNGLFYEDKNIFVFFGNKKFSNTNEILNSNNFIFGKQTHQSELIDVTQIKHSGTSTLISSSDGLITQTLNQKLAIYTADCVPCFIFSENKVFSLHLGWRSLQTGLLDKALTYCSDKPKIFIGPHIKQSSFEVGSEVVDLFREDPLLNKNTHSWTFAKGSKHHISLEKIISIKTQQKNAQIISSSIDTFKSNFHNSYRREKGKERNISFAFIKSAL